MFDHCWKHLKTNLSTKLNKIYNTGLAVFGYFYKDKLHINILMEKLVTIKDCVLHC